MARVGVFVCHCGSNIAGTVDCAAVAAAAARMPGVAYASDTLGFLLPMLLFGVGNGIVEPIIASYIAQGSPHGSLGATMSFYECIYGAFTCVSPILAGYVSQYSDVGFTYVALGAVTLLIIPFSAKLKKG